MSTNLAGDINKYEIIYLVLTYVMNGLCLTVSIVVQILEAASFSWDQQEL